MLHVQNTLRHLYATTEDSMNSPLPPSPSAYSPFLGQPNWAALNTPSNLQPRLSGSLDMAALGNPLSSLRRSIERRHSDREARRSSPAPGGFIGLALAQYARDAGSNSSTSSTLSSAAEPPESDAAGMSQDEAAAEEGTGAVVSDSEPAPTADVDHMSEILDSSDSLPEEALSMEEVAGQQSDREHERAEAEGSISFANAFGRADADAFADDASWGQDEGSVSFGTKPACAATPADTPPFCPPPSAALQQGGSSPRAGDVAPTPGPSSTGSVGAGSRGSFLVAAAQGTPSSTRHTFGPAEAIRSISLLPGTTQPRPADQGSVRPVPGRVSFRQAHGLMNQEAPPSDAAVGPSGSQRAEGTHSAEVPLPPQEWAAEEDGDVVIFDGFSIVADGSPALSASLQHIFDEALAQVDSAGSSPALSSVDDEAQTLLGAPDSKKLGAADHGYESEQNAGDEAGSTASPASSPSLSCYSELSSPGRADSAPEQPAAGSPRLIVLDNPLSVSALPGDDDSAELPGEAESAPAPATAASPEALLMQMANPRRSLQSALALAASLGAGILGADPLSPDDRAAPDQGHFVFSPAAGVPGEWL